MSNQPPSAGPKAREVLCDPRLVAARDRGYARLAAATLQSAQPAWLWGIYGSSSADTATEPDRWMAEALEELAAHAGDGLDPAAIRPLCVEFGPYGVHFIDSIFGAEVHFHEGQWWSHCLATPVGALPLPDLANHPTWGMATEFARAFLQAGVTAPVLGMPTVSSALNVAINLYGEAFLVALQDDPDAASRDLATISDLLKQIHRWYRQAVPGRQLQQVVAGQRLQPPGCGQLCGCSTALISARAYTRMIAPHDAALLAGYAHGGMIHLCGAHLQHLPTWAAMPSLRAVQLNDRAAEDLAAYHAGLRTDQVIYLNPCPGMPVERAMEITGGRRLVIVADPAALEETE